MIRRDALSDGKAKMGAAMCCDGKETVFGLADNIEQRKEIITWKSR